MHFQYSLTVYNTPSLFHFFKLDSIPDMCDELENMDRLREYYRRWKAWVSVRKFIMNNLFILNENPYFFTC